MVKKKKRKTPKNICPKCRKRMVIEYNECPFCGGGEYYECPNCWKNYDINTGEEL